MTKDEALDLALEALENSIVSPAMFATWGKYQEAREHKEKAITAIKQARSESVQEPRCAVIVEVFGKDWRLDYMSLPVGKHKLYTQQYIYTTPPAAQRQWVGLTDEEIKPLCDENRIIYGAYTVDFIQAIEAKLKEKNT